MVLTLLIYRVSTVIVSILKL